MTKKNASVRIVAYDPGLSTTASALGKYNVATGVTTVSNTHIFKATQIAKRKEHRDLCALYGNRMATLSLLQEELNRQIDTWQPDYIVAEDIFFNPKRPQAFIALLQWMVLIEQAAMAHQKPVYKIPTRSAKLCVTGNGGCDKPTVQDALAMLPDLVFKNRIDVTALTTDESDASAVLYAFTHMTLPELLQSLEAIAA